MTDELAIEASGLAKSYRGVAALDGVDLRVPRGGVFALLGPNGAGKTTTVRISLTGQYAALDEALTGEENLRMIARLTGLSRPAARRRAGELLEQFELTQAARRRLGTYSGGMRRRLDLAASLAGPPAVLFLDEPTTGLDPQSRLTTWRVVAGLAAAGTTVFLTTQYLEEADQLAGRIAVLDGGRLIAEGTAAELKRRVAPTRLDLTCVTAEAFAQVSTLLAGSAGPAVHLDPATLTVGAATDGSAADVRALLEAADPYRDLIASFAVREATLDDVFLTLTGGSHV